MYFRLENSKFIGFYEEKEKEGTFVEISVEDWNNLLNEQSQGKSIYYDSKTKKLDTITLGRFEELKGDMIITNVELLKQSILSELSELKTEHSEKEFTYNEKYLQRNRELDKNNLNNIVTMMMATKKARFDGWKFKNKDRRDEYVTLTMQDALELSKIMTEQTTKAMHTETVLRENLANLSDEELKNFNARKEFEKLWKN